MPPRTPHLPLPNQSPFPLGARTRARLVPQRERRRKRQVISRVDSVCSTSNIYSRRPLPKSRLQRGLSVGKTLDFRMKEHLTMTMSHGKSSRSSWPLSLARWKTVQYVRNASRSRHIVGLGLMEVYSVQNAPRSSIKRKGRRRRRERPRQEGSEDSSKATS